VYGPYSPYNLAHNFPNIIARYKWKNVGIGVLYTLQSFSGVGRH